VRNPGLRGHTCSGSDLRRLGDSERGVSLGCKFGRISCRHGSCVHAGARRGGGRRRAPPCWARRCLPAHLDRERVWMAERALASRFDLSTSRLNPQLAAIPSAAVAAAGGILAGAMPSPLSRESSNDRTPATRSSRFCSRTSRTARSAKRPWLLSSTSDRGGAGGPGHPGVANAIAQIGADET